LELAVFLLELMVVVSVGLTQSADSRCAVSATSCDADDRPADKQPDQQCVASYTITTPSR